MSDLVYNLGFHLCIMIDFIYMYFNIWLCIDARTPYVHITWVIGGGEGEKRERQIERKREVNICIDACHN